MKGEVKTKEVVVSVQCPHPLPRAMRPAKLTGQTSRSLSFFSPSITSESWTNTSSSGRDSTMTQDMAWLQKGARFQLASQGPGLCCGWLVRPGAGTFCPLASSLLDPQQHSSLNSRQPEGRDVSVRPGRGVWHGRGRGGSNRPGFSQPARARNTEFPCLWTLTGFLPPISSRR